MSHPAGGVALAKRVGDWVAAARKNNGRPTTFYAQDLRGMRSELESTLRSLGATRYEVYDDLAGLMRATLRVAGGVK